jgi:hypothetical protein
MNDNAEVDDAPPLDLPAPRVAVKWIAIAYGAFLALLIPFFLWAGRGGWFEHDDWDYLVLRKAGDPGDLFRSHNGHWETIPVLVYRILWAMFGLRYRPYELVSIILSLVGASLLLAVMLRARTRPWIAILTATLLVFFGDAQPNVALRITSITFVGFAVPFGLVQMLLADHDGPLDRRDWLGLAAGLASLLCSDVAIAMVFAVGVAMLVKRGWRIALFHLVPPAIVFSIWFETLGRKDLGGGKPGQLRPLPHALHFAWVLVTGTFEALTRTNGIGVVLVGLLLIGLFLTLRNAGSDRRKEAVVPCAMLLGAFFFAIETGLGRADVLRLGAGAVRAGHYMDVVAYLSLPAIALVADALVSRWRLVAPVLAVALLVAIPVNAHVLEKRAHAGAGKQALFRNTVLLIPRLSLAKVVPRTERPFNGTASPITVGWLLDSAREGRLPRRSHVTPGNIAVATLRMSLVLTGAPSTQCHPFRSAVVRRLATKGAVRFRGGGLRISYLSGGTTVVKIAYRTSTRPFEWQITNVGRPLSLRLQPTPVKVPAAMLCD